MGRFPRGLGKVHVCLSLGLLAALCVGCGTFGLPLAVPGDATQSNLRTALSGAGSFYSSNHDSYLGIGGTLQPPPGVSSIAKLDTGLRYVSGHRGSINQDVISVYAPSRSVLVMSAYGPGIQICWGILAIRRNRAHPYFPAFRSTASSGVFYFKTGSSASASCAAARARPAALSTNHFPAV